VLDDNQYTSKDADSPEIAQVKEKINAEINEMYKEISD
jgi:hypothetical protein